MQTRSGHQSQGWAPGHPGCPHVARVSMSLVQMPHVLLWTGGANLGCAIRGFRRDGTGLQGA